MKEKAIESFRNGDNCAQVVLMAFAKQLGFNEETAYQATSGFGGGMGRQGLTCGAVTGAYMAISIFNSQNESDPDKRKDKNAEMIQEFSRAFKEKHRSLNCKELLNADWNTEEGKKHVSDNNLSEKVCEACINTAIDIVRTRFIASNKE